jgi:hypothetical protein
MPTLEPPTYRLALQLLALTLQAIVLFVGVTWSIGELRTQLSTAIAILQTKVETLVEDTQQTRQRLDRMTDRPAMANQNQGLPAPTRT